MEKTLESISVIKKNNLNNSDSINYLKSQLIFATEIEDFIKYEDVKHISVEEFYNRSDYSSSIFRNKYIVNNDKTPADVFWRVTCYIASAEEKEEDKEYWSRRWFHEMWTGQWMAAGSILQGAANPNKVSLANCTGLRFGRYDEKGDTLRDIYETAYAVSKTAAYRQGLGVLFNQRPKGMAVHNSSRESQGVTHWMKYINEIGNYIGQKGRIPAMLLAIKDNHPDLLDFITIKSDQKTIDNANISVQWSDDFMRTLEQDGDWTMRYETDKGDALEKTVKASEIFDAFVANNWAFAEPGAQFIDTAKRYSNSDYLGCEKFKVVSTNACVTGYTRILTKEGYKRIDSLVGKTVEVWNGKEWSFVTPQITGTNEKVYRVYLSSDNHLDCTGYHKWLIEDKGVEIRKSTLELYKGDKLFEYSLPEDYEEYNDNVTIEKIEYIGVFANVYCFTELKNNSGCFEGIITGQCSEQYLESSGWDISAGLCVLSSFNMGVLPAEIETCKSLLRDHIGASMTRFLDNVITMELKDERYAIPGQKYSLEQLRRIGAGVTNLDGWLIQNDIGYDTEEGHNVIFEMVDSFNLGLYEESIRLGFEKGNFLAFDREKYIQSPFVKQMMKRHDLDFLTMRNVCCSSIAPTGSISLLFHNPVISYGIEPILGFYWWKRNRTSGKYVWHFCIPDFVREILLKKGIDLLDYGLTKNEVRDDTGELGIKIVDIINKHFPKIKFKPAHEINPFNKIKLMSNLTKYCIDSSISVTYNLPEDVKHETIKNIYLEGWRQGVKSISIYRDKSRTGIVEFVPPYESEKRYSENISETEPIIDEINTHNAPKRPEKLPAEVHHVTVHGEEWIAFVGTYYSKPFEVFAGKSEDINLSRKTTKGVIEKIKGNYYFYPENTDDKISITKNFMEDNQSALTRQISLNLRHGTPLTFIMEQLDRSKGLVHDFSKVIARVLKKYLKFEETNGLVKCSNPECKSKNITFVEGCLVCNNCGYGKC